ALPARAKSARAVVGDTPDMVAEREPGLWEAGLDHGPPRLRIDLVAGVARPEHGHAGVDRAQRGGESPPDRFGRFLLAVLQPVPAVRDAVGAVVVRAPGDADRFWPPLLEDFEQLLAGAGDVAADVLPDPSRLDLGHISGSHEGDPAPVGVEQERARPGDGRA